MYGQTSIRSILSSEARLVFSAYFGRLGSSLPVAWLSALGGPASVAGATALVSTLMCLWLTFVDMARASLWKGGLFLGHRALALQVNLSSAVAFVELLSLI